MPIPTPNDGETKDAYISRCMGDSKMLSEYPDVAQRTAICNINWKGSADSAGVTLTEEIFAVGLWNGMEFTAEDLNLIANAFHALGDNHKVPLKMGHNNDQPLTDGQPALGWVTDVWVAGSKLMAKFEHVPKIVAEAIKSKLYRTKSVELDMGVEYKGDYYFWVLSGVALLGADIPAVNTLNDLGALMSKTSDTLHFKKRMAFTAINDESEIRRKAMADPTLQQELDTLKAQFAALKADHDKLIETNRTLEQKIAEQKVEFKVLQDAEKHRKELQERGDLEKNLDQMVKDGKLAPFSRDEWMRDYDTATDKKSILFAVDKLKKTIESNPAYFGAEQARNKAKQNQQESDKNASEVVRDRTREYMAKHGEKNFSVAKRAVLLADSELAARYKEEA